MSNHQRAAYFSPLPPQHTGIADYSLELLLHLAKRIDLTLYAEDPGNVTAELTRSFRIQPIDAYPHQRWEYDLAIYQMGNSPFHEKIYSMALRYPGMVVLHDYFLHHLIVGNTVAKGNNANYMREMGYALGLRGLRWAKEITEQGIPYPVFEVPLNNRLIDASLGLVVHSRYVQEHIRKQNQFIPIVVSPQPVAVSTMEHTQRHLLPWPREAVIFASIGQITPTKQVDQALRAFARLRKTELNAYYLVVGEWNKEQYNLQAIIRELGLESVVKCTGFVDKLEDLQRWIASGDVIVNLRYPTMGETSAVALRTLAAGRALIVNDHGWYSELPDSVCCKVPVQDDEALYQVMHRLALDPVLRHNYGEQAIAYIAKEHTADRVVECYLELVNRLLG